MHWGKWKKLKKEWRQALTYLWYELDPDITEPVEITYMRSYWNRPLDIDNLYASFKLIGDALKPPTTSTGALVQGAHSVLSEDDPSVIGDLDARQYRLHKDEHPQTRLIFRNYQE